MKSDTNRVRVGLVLILLIFGSIVMIGGCDEGKQNEVQKWAADQVAQAKANAQAEPAAHSGGTNGITGKIAEAKKKIDNCEILIGQLTLKRKEVDDSRSALLDEKRGYRDEAKSLAVELASDGTDQLKHKKLQQLLILIQQREAYAAEIDRLVRKYDGGRNDLDFLKNKLRADVKLMEARKTDTISGLQGDLAQMETLMKEYESLATKIPVTMTQGKLRETNEILNEIKNEIKAEREAKAKAERETIAKEKAEKEARTRSDKETKRQPGNIPTAPTPPPEQPTAPSIAQTRFEERLGNGIFAPDWYERIDVGWLFVAKQKTGKNRNLQAFVQRILRTPKYYIFEVRVDYLGGLGPYHIWFEKKQIRLLDVNQAQHYPVLLFSEDGQAVPESCRIDIRSSVRLYLVFRNVPDERFHSGTMIYGDNDSFIGEYIVSKTASKAQNNGLGSKATSDPTTRDGEDGSKMRTAYLSDFEEAYAENRLDTVALFNIKSGWLKPIDQKLVSRLCVHAVLPTKAAFIVYFALNGGLLADGTLYDPAKVELVDSRGQRHRALAMAQLYDQTVYKRSWEGNVTPVHLEGVFAFFEPLVAELYTSGKIITNNAVYIEFGNLKPFDFQNNRVIAEKK